MSFPALAHSISLYTHESFISDAVGIHLGKSQVSIRHVVFCFACCSEALFIERQFTSGSYPIGGNQERVYRHIRWGKPHLPINTGCRQACLRINEQLEDHTLLPITGKKCTIFV